MAKIHYFIQQDWTSKLSTIEDQFQSCSVEQSTGGDIKVSLLDKSSPNSGDIAATIPGKSSFQSFSSLLRLFRTTRGQWPCRTCGELKVNKQLTISKILNFLSKHLCFEQFQRLKPPSGLFEKSKQTAESKQTADIIQNSEILFQTSFLWAVSVFEAPKWLIWDK